MRRIRAAARDNAIFVSLGFSEIELATCFISQVMISPTGEVINHRRKIKPSHVEKLIYGDGSGDTFETVIDTEIGRLGQFNCWENTNPFLRAYAVSKGEQVHVAAWPLYTGASTQSYPNPWICSAEATELETRSYALEVGAYTLAPFQIISAEGVRKNTPEGHAEEEHFEHYNGHARAFGPGGSIIVDKPAQDFEGLLFVDIDLAETHLPKALMDFGGHYMRPDLMRLLVDTRRKDLITHADEEGRISATRTIDRVGLSKPLDSPSAAPSSREVADLDLDKQGKSKTNAQRRNRT
jgi:cyanide hydratase